MSSTQSQIATKVVVDSPHTLSSLGSDGAGTHGDVMLDGWTIVSGSDSTGDASPRTGSDASSSASETDDVVHHFRQVGMPDYKKWAKVLYKGGYGDMDMLKDADLDALQEEFKIPSGVKKRMETAIASMGSEEIAMPEGDLDEAAPKPKEESETSEGSGKTGTPEGDLDEAAPVALRDSGWGWKVGVAALGLPALGAVGGALICIAAAGAVSTLMLAPKPKEESETSKRSGGTGTPEVGADGTDQEALPDNEWDWKVGVAALGLAVLVADCLDGDAEITMANRSKKKIKHLKKGEKILTFNHGRLKVKTIEEVKEGYSRTMFAMELKSCSGETAKVVATGGHPFFAKEKGWSVIVPDKCKFTKPVLGLKEGDKLVLQGRKTADVLRIERVSARKTYNLVLDGPGAFFVHDVLSHSGLPASDKKE